MVPIQVVLGFVLLIASTQLYWLFVGGVGFIIGSYLGSNYNLYPTEWDLIRACALFSVLGIAIALPLKKVAVGLAGFIAGGFLALVLPEYLGMETGPWRWYLFGLIGSISALLVYFKFDLGMILVSSLTGATLMVQATKYGALHPTLVLFIFFFLGMATQTVLLQYMEPGIK